jgi:ABC-type phosphate transport system ATPase subunit
MRPHGGSVSVLGQDMSEPKIDLRAIRRRVGLVFQFAEAQLFEQFVGDDIAYGPRNLGLSREEVRARVRKAMESVGLDFEEFKDPLHFWAERRPDAAGGAGRCARPGAGSPGIGRADRRAGPTGTPAAARVHPQPAHRQGVTLVIVSHNMEELAEVCDRLYVISGGRTVMSGTPGVIFNRASDLRELGLDAPDVTLIADRLKTAGWLPPEIEIYKLPQAVDAIGAVLAALPCV